MADVWMLDGQAECEECDWSTAGKNALGNAAQHSQKEGHSVKGEQYQAFEVDP